MSSQYKATVLADSPIRYYRLNETSGTVAIDIGSQAQNGTLNGGITLNQAGLITGDLSGASMLFNGSTGYISLPTTGLPTGNASWSMECWIKTTGSILAGDFMGFGNQSTTQIWWFAARSGGTITDLRQWAGADIVGGGLSSNSIIYLAATWDGTTAKFYINGTLSGSGPATSAIVAGIAQIGNVSGSFWNSNMQEVAWYSTALTAIQIANHYNVGIASYPLNRVSPFTVISHNDWNQAINILQQPSGGQEVGKYHLGGNGYIVNAIIDCNFHDLSRQSSTPISLTIDTADSTPSGVNAPTTATLKPGVIDVKATTTGAVAGGNCGGNYTLNF